MAATVTEYVVAVVVTVTAGDFRAAETVLAGVAVMTSVAVVAAEVPVTVVTTGVAVLATAYVAAAVALASS